VRVNVSESISEAKDTDSIKVWVIGTGPSDRTYFEDIFSRYGVALIGCGELKKPYTPELEDTPEFKDLGKNLKSSIRTIATRMKRGHLVIARRGRSVALGLGVVRCEYKYREEWVEVQGWDLYHQVRVEWLGVDGLGDDGEEPFGHARGRTGKPFSSLYVACELGDGDAREWALKQGATRALEVAAFDERELPELPELLTPQAELESREMPPWFKEASRTIRDLRDDWGWDDISESSIVAHIVVPMLAELGWRRTQIKLEEHWVDVQVEDDEGSPVLLIEAKAPRFGISAARKQAVGYWEKGREKGWWGGADPWLMATNGVNFTLERPDDLGSRVGANLCMPTSEAQDFIETLAFLSKR
jgi:hypothetical protein